MGLFDFFRKKKPAAGPNGERGDSEENHATRHCFVICRTAEPGDLSRAGEVAAQVFGRGYSAHVAEGDIITVTHGEDAVGFLAHVAAPIPGGEAEENADGNFLWPDGKDEAAKHRSHVIVTNITAGEQTPIQSAIAVSRLALVALKLFDGIGVYWGNASVCNSREAFEGICEDISEKHVPLLVLLRFQFVRAPDDGVGLYTLGMRQFGLMDIEVDRCQMEPQELLEFVGNVAHYLVQSGPVIADGNTVGGSEEERILVRHRPSMIDKDRRVYKIVFEGSKVVSDGRMAPHHYILVPEGSLQDIKQAIIENGKVTNNPPRKRVRVRMWTLDDGSTLVQFPADTHAYELSKLNGWISYTLREKCESPSQAAQVSHEKSWFSNADETFYFEPAPTSGEYLVGITDRGKKVILDLLSNLLALYPKEGITPVENFPGSRRKYHRSTNEDYKKVVVGMNAWFATARFVEPPAPPDRAPDAVFVYEYDDLGTTVNHELSEYSALAELPGIGKPFKAGCLPIILVAAGIVFLAAVMV